VVSSSSRLLVWWVARNRSLYDPPVWSVACRIDDHLVNDGSVHVTNQKLDADVRACRERVERS
jgi:hypothetical protein